MANRKTRTPKQVSSTAICPTASELIAAVADELHQTMRAYAADPWWFFGQDKQARAKGQEEGWHQDLFLGQAPTLAATIRVDTYEFGEPPTVSLDLLEPHDPKHAWVTTCIDFGNGPAARHPKITQTSRPWQPTDKANRQITVRIGLEGEGEPYGTLGLPPLKAMPEGERLFWLRGARKVLAKEPTRGDKLWWIDPTRTPVEVTRFTLIFYLFQAEMIDLEQHPEIREWLMTFLYRRTEPGTMFLALRQMKESFALPGDWRQVRKYFAKAIQTVEGESRTITKAFADEAGLPLATANRWRKTAGREQGYTKSRVPLNEPIRARVQELARQRVHRRAAMVVLTKAGKSKEAARKYIQRHLAKGETFEAIIRKVGSRP
ncbi:MAG: hypothetical protein IH977_01755 [Nitrospinae bacterium]|nr:hypothetical protein [Nitrospinota bacterium]